MTTKNTITPVDNKEVALARSELSAVVYAFKTGQLDYKEAKRRATPYLAVLDRVGAKIAKKHKRRHQPISWAAYIR